MYEKLLPSLSDNSLEKIAARAWKKRISELGDESVNKLLKSKVFDRNKELKGLNLGTNKILQKANAKNVGDPKKAASHMMQSLKDSGQIDSSDMMYSLTKDSVKNMGLFGSPVAKHSKWGKEGITMVPRKRGYRETNKLLDGMRDQLSSFGLGDGNLPSKLKRKDREGKKWANAILARHEADEVRHGAKVMKSNRLSGENFSGQRAPYTGIGSHLTPKVLMSEASNVALAPKSTQGYFKKLRSANVGSPSTEREMLKELGNGFDYNKSSAVFDKKTARKSENNAARRTKELLGL